MKDLSKFAVLGAGHGGHAAAADLSLAGFEVNLFELPKFRANIEPILKRGGIEITGAARNGFAELNKVTTNIKEAIEGVDIVMIVSPAFAQKVFLELCIPHLENGQIVMLNPGRFGTLELSKMMKERGVGGKVKMAETNTLSYVCRCIGPAQVKVMLIAKELLLATFPGKNIFEIIDIFREIYPSVIPATHVIESGLNALNAVFHPAEVLLNTGWIEHTKGNFYIYREGTTRSVSRIIEAVDRERLAVLKALRLEEMSFVERMYRTGYSPLKGTVYETVTAKEFIKAPESLQNRYIVEDIPFGLVPIASIGDMLGVSTPVVRSLIVLASEINHVDYWKEGRNVEKLGISGLSPDELKKFLINGSLNP